jgi:hypothetical protein
MDLSCAIARMDESFEEESEAFKLAAGNETLLDAQAFSCATEG